MIKVRLGDDEKEGTTISVADLIQILEQVKDKSVPVTYNQIFHLPIVGGCEIQVYDDEGNETDEVEQFQLYGW